MFKTHYQPRPCLGCNNMSVSAGHMLCPACQLVAEVRVNEETGQLGLVPKNAIPLEVMIAQAAAVLQALSPSAAVPAAAEQPDVSPHHEVMAAEMESGHGEKN